MKRLSRSLNTFLALILTLILTVSFSFADQKTQEKQFKNIQDELFFLLKQHQKHINLIYKNIGFDSFEKEFFATPDFIKHDISQGFLINIDNAIRNGSVKGFTAISYTSASLINGKFKSVSYKYKNDGYKILLTRVTNNNGNVLKASYKYSVKNKTLLVNDFRNNNIIHKKSHSIKI